MNKKADGMPFFLANTIKVLIGFFIIALIFTTFIRNASEAADPATCRATAFARERLEVDVKVADISTPLLCSTQDIKIKGKESEIKKELADQIAQCWWQFGNGLIDDPIKKGTIGFSKQQCMVCDTIVIKNDEFSVSTNELREYLAEETYIVESLPGGKENQVKYLDYVQSYGGGEGRIVIVPSQPLSGSKTPEGVFDSNDVYAISFGSSTGECGTWCAVGGGTGAVGGAVGGAALCVWAGPGALVCGAVGAVAGVIGGAVGAYATKKVTETDLVKSISKRKLPTIYVTPLNMVAKNGVCTQRG